VGVEKLGPVMKAQIYKANYYENDFDWKIVEQLFEIFHDFTPLWILLRKQI
jgi:hypothetical protein